MHKECADIVADLFFAYINKDEYFPHSFEIEAIEKAVEYLGENYNGEKYNKAWFQTRLSELKKLSE